MEVKLIDTTKRTVLSEGRSYGMAFGFAKKTGDNEFTAITPMSPCKDYLNDVVWAEHAKKPITACGLKYEPLGDVIDDTTCYLTFGFLPRDKSNISTDTKYLADKAVFLSKLDTILQVVHSAEITLGIEQLCELLPIAGESDKRIIAFSNVWCSSTPAISLFAALFRAGEYYDGKSPLELYLDNCGCYQWRDYVVGYRSVIKDKQIPLTPDPKTYPLELGVHGYGFGRYIREVLNKNTW